MASNSSSSSGFTAEERIGALETALGRLRAKHDDQKAKLEALSKAGEQTWDLLNKELMQLRADFSEQMDDMKDETRTGFKDAANTHGNFGHRIAALEAEVTTLKAKLEK